MSSISSKNRTKTSLIVVKLNSFVRFLEETSDWKNHFDFVWPLKQIDIQISTNEFCNIIILTDNTVSHFQCGVRQCDNKWYRPDDFCPWWWFGSYQKSKPMNTCSTGKFSQYFEDHHFKLKLNRNAGWYKRPYTGYFWYFFVQKAFVKNLKSWWNKRDFIFLKKILAAKIIYSLVTNPQK